MIGAVLDGIDSGLNATGVGATMLPCTSSAFPPETTSPSRLVGDITLTPPQKGESYRDEHTHAGTNVLRCIDLQNGHDVRAAGDSKRNQYRATG